MRATPHSGREIVWGLASTRLCSRDTSHSTFRTYEPSRRSASPAGPTLCPLKILMPETCSLKPRSVVRPLDALQYLLSHGLELVEVFRLVVVVDDYRHALHIVQNDVVFRFFIVPVKSEEFRRTPGAELEDVQATRSAAYPLGVPGRLLGRAASN